MRQSIRGAALLGLLLAACATPTAQIHPGMSGELVSAIMGPPTYEVRMANGSTRRFYHDTVSVVPTWSAAFDEGGRLVEFAPATTSTEFAEIVPGKWVESDVLGKFGMPDKTEANVETREKSLIYRFMENGVRPAYMYVTLDPQGNVARCESIPIVQKVSHR